ncbi:RDD family protein [Limnofasciculus baicalensis]|uniref:RDD family protein n=1 Tax=Limnofasciculus baicalensis BBK-W-15 TaxID=2699891 RepID=A0AAE3GV70_9CYAN|nr:RDD family protein [Limnofasciculus baicalensis]MCP2730566.1 RDD family protein [Limnofasciculus baicalensis BBK-W-15]
MNEIQYAGFGKRFLAAFLDGIILVIINIILGFALGGNKNLVALVGILVGWVYYAVQESSPKQATIGKQALGIVVTDLNNQPISFVIATIRHFSKFLSGIILLIGYLMALFTEKKQALHDMLAGTLVVNK